MKFIKYTSIILTFVMTISWASGSALAIPLGGGGTGPSATPALQSQQDACSSLQQLDSADDCSKGAGTVTNLTSLVIGILAKVVGIISVIVIIFAGFRFITANGEAQAVSNARNTLIYAIIGLIIAVLAQFIASHVLNTAANVSSGYINNEISTSKYS